MKTPYVEVTVTEVKVWHVPMSAFSDDGVDVADRDVLEDRMAEHVWSKDDHEEFLYEGNSQVQKSSLDAKCRIVENP